MGAAAAELLARLIAGESVPLTEPWPALETEELS